MISVSFCTMAMSLRPHSAYIFASRTTLPDAPDLALSLSKGAKRRRERASAMDNEQLKRLFIDSPTAVAIILAYAKDSRLASSYRV
jgi:hypothetical protein